MGDDTKVDGLDKSEGLDLLKGEFSGLKKEVLSRREEARAIGASFDGDGDLEKQALLAQQLGEISKESPGSIDVTKKREIQEDFDKAKDTLDA